MKICRILMLALASVMLVGCTIAKQPAVQAINYQTPAPSALLEPAPAPSSVAMPTKSPAVTPVPTPSPTPIPAVAKIGAVGDILMMTSQISAAKSAGGYDFSRSFAPLCSLFEQADIVCANLEVPLAGEAEGYTQPRATVPPATLENPSPTAAYQTFNAPDALAANLMACGIGLVTTANNHALDRGADGLFRTIETLRAAGLLQTGTFLSQEDRDTPCIVEINGIKIGFIACTFSVNGRNGSLSGDACQYAVARLEEASVKADIANAREAGAEFIIVFPHSGTEYEKKQNSSQQKLYKKLAQWGADAVFASHPHVVQPIEWVEVTRDDGSLVKVPIAYSLGNFISNQAPSPRDYGLYVQLTLERAYGGKVVIKQLDYLPLYCLKQRTESGLVVHQALPCYADTAKVEAFEPLNDSELNGLNAARDYIIGLIGHETAGLLE